MDVLFSLPRVPSREQGEQGACPASGVAALGKQWANLRALESCPLAPSVTPQKEKMVDELEVEGQLGLFWLSVQNLLLPPQPCPVPLLHPCTL